MIFQKPQIPSDVQTLNPGGRGRPVRPGATGPSPVAGAAESAADGPRDCTEEVSPAESGPNSGRERILLVEDDADVRMVTRDVLKGAGYQISEAANGSEALTIWRSQAPQIDLLLTDVVLPGGLNGRDLADRLQKERPELKVILMSGYNSDRLGKIPSGLILSKPFSLDYLTATVRRYLSHPETI